jgi:uncharacterized membrane protein
MTGDSIVDTTVIFIIILNIVCIIGGGMAALTAMILARDRFQRCR